MLNREIYISNDIKIDNVINNRINFTSTFDYFGIETITISVNDSQSIDSQDVQVTVVPTNDPPLSEDIERTIDEDDEAFINLIGIDIDSEQLTYIIEVEPVNVVVDSVINNDGTITYTPDDNFYGNDSFTYKVNDGFLDSNISTVSITVSPVQDSPIIIPLYY